jgi:hypothetical protein
MEHASTYHRSQRMTTERNAQGVDVLAVLKKEADYSACLGPRAAEARTKRLLQVRAAVAELVEASRPFRRDPNVLGRSDHFTTGLAVTLGQIRRLDAALAKFPEPRP